MVPRVFVADAGCLNFMKADPAHLPHSQAIPILPGVPNGEGREGHAVKPPKLDSSWPRGLFLGTSKEAVADAPCDAARDCCPRLSPGAFEQVPMGAARHRTAA